MTRHPGTEGNELHPSDVIIPDPSGGDGRLSVRNDLAAEFAGLAISSTQPTDMPNGGVWVNLSAEPTGIDRLQTYDDSTDAFIPISADSTVVSEQEPEPEIGLLWFEPVDGGANLYAANSESWEFLQLIPAIPDRVVNRAPLDEGAGTTFSDAVGDADGTLQNDAWFSDGVFEGGTAPEFDQDTQWGEWQPRTEAPITWTCRVRGDSDLTQPHPETVSKFVFSHNREPALEYHLDDEAFRLAHAGDFGVGLVSDPLSNLAGSIRVCAVRLDSSEMALDVWDADGNKVGDNSVSDPSTSFDSSTNYLGNEGPVEDERLWGDAVDLFDVYDEFLGDSDLENVIQEVYFD